MSRYVAAESMGDDRDSASSRRVSVFHSSLFTPRAVSSRKDGPLSGIDVRRCSPGAQPQTDGEAKGTGPNELESEQEKSEQEEEEARQDILGPQLPGSQPRAKPTTVPISASFRPFWSVAQTKMAHRIFAVFLGTRPPAESNWRLSWGDSLQSSLVSTVGM